MSEFTNNLHLEKPDFNFSPWHDEINRNFDIIDAAIKGAFDFGGIVGVWENSTAYVTGNRVIDTVSNTVWQVEVDHTSAAAPTTFADDRAANPTYWSQVELGVSFRGTWTTGTNYAIGDMVYDTTEHVVVIGLLEHVAGADIRDDIAALNWTVLADLKPAVDAAAASAAAAAASATAAAVLNPATRTEAASLEIPASTHFVRTAGYASVGDKGGAIAIDTDNGRPIWFTSSGATARPWYIADAIITPQMLGAVGDGVTDDTVAFQAALDMNTHIFVPRAEYKVSSLTLRQGQVLAGQNQYDEPLASQPFILNGNGVNTTLVVGDGDGDPRGITIRDISITNPGASCIVGNHSPNLLIERCRLASTGAVAHTINIDMCYRCIIRDNYIGASGGADALRALDNNNGMVIENNTISGGATGRAMQIGQSQGIRINGNIIEGSLNGIHVGGDSDAGNGNCNGVIIQGNYFEQCSTPLKLGTQFTISGLDCRGNYISNQSTTTIVARTAAIQFGRIRSGKIVDNALYVHATEDAYWIHLVDAAGGFEDVTVSNYINGTPANMYQYQGAFAANGSVQSSFHAEAVLDFKADPIDIPPVFTTFDSFAASAIVRYISAIGQDTAAITRGEIVVQPGDWLISGEMLSIAQSLQIRGRGRPVLRWNGAAAGNMFKFRDSVSVHMSDLILLGKNGAVPNIFIYSDDTDSASGVAAQNENMVLERLCMGRLHSQNTGNNTGAVYGLYVGGPNNANNDQFVVRDCQIYDCSGVGIYLVNAQSIWNSFENMLLDTCGKGLWFGSNSQSRNLHFNRNTECDLVIFRDTIHDIVGFNAENSARVIDQSQGASISINGGKVTLSALLTDDYWAQFGSTNYVSLRNWLVDAAGTVNKKIKFTSSSASRGYISIKNCRLPNGDARTGYELNAPASGSGLTYEIEQGSFRVRGNLEGTLTADFASIASGGTAQNTLTVGATAGVAAGDLVLTSLSVAQQSMMLCGCVHSANLLIARLFNKTAGAIDLASAKIRWRKLQQSMIKAQASTTYNPPVIANGDGVTNSLSIPCAFGDIVFSSQPGLGSMLSSSYVSAANTASVRYQNESGGGLDVASGTLTFFVMDDNEFDFINSKVIDPASIADNAQEVFTVNIPGVKVGDHAMCSFSQDMQGLVHTVEISADDTATVVFFNGTGAAVDLASGVLKVGVFISLG